MSFKEKGKISKSLSEHLRAIPLKSTRGEDTPSEIWPLTHGIFF